MSGRTRTALGLLVPALRRRPQALAGVLLWSAVQATPAIVFGRALAGAADAFLGRHLVAGFAWLGVLVLAAAVGAAGSRQAMAAVAGIVEPLRDELVDRVVRGALRRSTGGPVAPDSAAVARITSQVEIVRDTVAGLLSVVGTFAFSAGGAVLGLFTLAPVGAALVVVPLAASLGVFAATLPVAARRQRAAILSDEAVAAEASTAARALRDVTACGAEDEVGAHVGSRIDAQAQAACRVAWVTATRSLALGLGGWLPLLAIVALSPWLLRRGITAGALLGMLAYVRGGVQPALHTLIHAVGGSGTRLVVTLERIAEAGMPAAGGAVPAAAPSQGRPHGDLELRGVTFAYGPDAEPVIRDLDLSIPDGDHLAIVGPSGIGKSTLAALVTGMLRPLAGEVRLGGVPLTALHRANLPDHRVLIPQEAYVFAGTLRENLAYLRPDDPSRRELDAVADAVGLCALVARLGGHDAQVDPGALSAGERQLVALARAYLARAPIRVLDEATCHLDPVAEARAERALASLPGTLVVIAHRVSSALRARRVLVLDGVHAVAGSHEALMSTSPLYRELVGHWRSTAVVPPAADEAGGCARRPR